jgi:hypothetical protein
MTLVWKGLIPLALLNLLCVMFVKEFDLPHSNLFVASAVLFLGAAYWSTRAGRQRLAAAARARSGGLAA